MTVGLIAATCGCASGEKRYAIIHTDDAGMSHSVNLATIEGMEKGVVSSCSIMVPCAWFPEMARYAKEHPEKDYGIHLTLTSEWDDYRWGPVAPPSKVPSLIDEQGYLWDNSELVAKNAKAEEVEIELRAQIDRAKAFGVPLTHLDSHMGALFTRPDLTQVYVKVGLEYDLPVLFIRASAEALKKERPALAAIAERTIAKLDAAGFPILDALDTNNYGVAPDKKKAYYLKLLKGLKPGVTEIIIHVGHADAELNAITSSSARRDADLRVFTDPEVIATIQELGIEVITWKQFRKLVAESKSGG
jgi:hypothetical protein